IDLVATGSCSLLDGVAAEGQVIHADGPTVGGREWAARNGAPIRADRELGAIHAWIRRFTRRLGDLDRALLQRVGVGAVNGVQRLERDADRSGGRVCARGRSVRRTGRRAVEASQDEVRPRIRLRHAVAAGLDQTAIVLRLAILELETRWVQ